jgi:hypothetical protein
MIATVDHDRDFRSGRRPDAEVHTSADRFRADGATT